MSEQWWLKDFRLAVLQENSDLLVFFGGYANLNHGIPVASQVADQTHLYMSLGDDIEKHFHCLNMFTFSVPGVLEICCFFPKKASESNVDLSKFKGVMVWKEWWNKSTKLGVQKSWFGKPSTSAERLLELAEGTLRILWMQQFSRGMSDVQLDLLCCS